MKKTLSLILALLMSISCASFVAADDAIADENAVAEAPTPYDEAILFLQDNKIMQGYEDGLIHAEKPVERYMMALLNARISTGWTDNTLWEDDIANDSGYTDLAGTVAEDYYGAISYADQKGIVEGYPDGSFKPEQQVTYREALAMATRTLGYTGLKWPWGNIEKAVNLGLTDGIEDVAYTTPLNRGQVAQIIYNTLFAKVNGETLAMNIFGIDRAWETILVTADSRSAYNVGGSTTKAGQVAFQIVKADGTLDSEVYYVNEALEIGHPYRALFNVDEESNLVELVKAVECESIVEDNEGLTNNEGKAYDDAYPVNTLLGKYEIVSKYDLSNILANSDYDSDEIILVDAINEQTKKVITGNKYAFDLSTGDIWNIDVDGKLVSIKWYYSDILNAYFEKVAIGGEGDEVYKMVADEDVEDLLNDRYHTKDETTNGFTFLSAVPGKTAYSHVEIWNVEGKAYGWYESYRLGEVSAATPDCSCGEEEDVAGWNFAALNAGSASANAFGKTYALDSECDDCVDYVVDSAIDLASAKYVIYGVNEATKTIKVVKEVEKLVGDVEDLTDMDTYYATGIFRGYRMSKGTVTIGDTNIPYGYDTLVGNTILVDMDDDADGIKSRGLYSDWFAGLVNQYVEYVVVDGKIVYIETVGAKSDEWIVVENYVGISSDGYIVVGGYSTSDLKYDMFRIASYDGWKLGDKFWYGRDFDSDFNKGTIYAITSYDATTDTYNVKTVDADEIKENEVTITANVDGYRFIGDKYYKMQSTDKYIIIDNNIWEQNDAVAENVQTMPIRVYQGILPAYWTVTADLIVGDEDDGTLILADVSAINGFDRNAYEYSMVVVLDKVILDWVYDGYGTDAEWYIQGATGYKMEAFNLFTGDFTTVYGGYNLDIEEDYIYAAIDGVITQDVEINWFELRNHYWDWNANSATYVISNAYDYAEIDEESELNEILSDAYNFVGTYDVVEDITTYFVTFGDDAFVVDSIEKFDAAKHIAGLEADTVDATYIYDPDTKDVLVYVYAGTGNKVDYELKDQTLTFDVAELPLGTDTVKIIGTAKYDALVDGDTDKIINVTIKELSYEFEDINATHANIIEKGYYFGIDKHNYKDTRVLVKETFNQGGSYTPVVEEYTIPTDIFAGNYTCEDDCKLVKKVVLPLESVVLASGTIADMVTFNTSVEYSVVLGDLDLTTSEIDALLAQLDMVPGTVGDVLAYISDTINLFNFDVEVGFIVVNNKLTALVNPGRTDFEGYNFDAKIVDLLAK